MCDACFQLGTGPLLHKVPITDFGLKQESLSPPSPDPKIRCPRTQRRPEKRTWWSLSFLASTHVFRLLVAHWSCFGVKGARFRMQSLPLTNHELRVLYCCYILTQLRTPNLEEQAGPPHFLIGIRFTVHVFRFSSVWVVL